MALTEEQERILADMKAFLAELRAEMGKTTNEDKAASPKAAGARVARSVLTTEAKAKPRDD